MRIRTLIALTTVGAAGLAACGGGDDNSKADRRTDGESTVEAGGGPGQSLRRIETAKETTSESGSLEVGVTFEMGVDDRSASFTMEGLADAATGAGRFEMSIDAPGLSGDPLEFVSDGELLWVSSDGEQWYEISVDELGQGAATNTDPTAFLELLNEVGDVTEVGTEEIDGAETTHYHAETDFAQLVEAQDLDFDADDAEELGIDSVPIDVWIDGEDLIRQLQMHLEIDADGMSASMDMDVDIAPSSEPVVIDGPPAGEIIDGSVEDLTGLIASS